MAECDLPKVEIGVRFPVPAPKTNSHPKNGGCLFIFETKLALCCLVLHGCIIKDMEQKVMDRYVSERLAHGDDPEVIARHLALVGWPEVDVKDALARALVAQGVPAPEDDRLRGGRTAPTVDVVLNFFSFILLAIVATAFGVLYYQIINAFFPDPLQIMYGSYDASRSAMHYAMAALLIGFPLYVFSVRLWFKRTLEGERKVESKLSKWLTYLVLLVAAVTIVGDLITSIYFLLQGELTLRFFLKAIVILAVAGAVFGFYFMERRIVQYGEVLPRPLFRSFFSGVSALVVLGIVLGFAVGGSPALERERGLDRQRASDLMNIASCVASYGATYKRLPASLDELEKSGAHVYCMGNMNDPETGVPYEYALVTPSRVNGSVTEGEFELCANFALSTLEGETLPETSYVSETKWMKHASGRSCDNEIVVLETALSLSPDKLQPAIPATPR